MEEAWAKIACGRTPDQLDLTEMAHDFLQSYGLRPRSLKF